jgi:hypothetical protein
VWDKTRLRRSPDRDSTSPTLGELLVAKASQGVNVSDALRCAVCCFSCCSGPACLACLACLERHPPRVSLRSPYTLLPAGSRVSQVLLLVWE